MKKREEKKNFKSLKRTNKKNRERLSRNNQKIIKRISFYLHTFALTGCEREMLKADLIAMAWESEEQNTVLTELVGEDLYSYCGELAASIKDTRFPKKRFIFLAAGIYFLFASLLYFKLGFSFLFSQLVLLSEVFRDTASGHFLDEMFPVAPGFIVLTGISAVTLLCAAAFFLNARTAFRYASDISYKENAFRHGIRLCIIVCLQFVLMNLHLITIPYQHPQQILAVILIIIAILFLELLIPGIYLFYVKKGTIAHQFL